MISSKNMTKLRIMTKLRMTKLRIDCTVQKAVRIFISYETFYFVTSNYLFNQV